MRAGWLVAVMAVACAGPVPTVPFVPAPSVAVRRATGPDILLVTLDTTRADRLSAYGDPRAAHTPTFDGLAARGTLFTRAYASETVTIPSHATILTGTYPPQHGVRDNGNHVLSSAAVTLAERFHEAGWATGAFTAAYPTRRRWGFDQGFEHYAEGAPNGEPSELDWSDQRPADEVVADALSWLAGVDGPAFVWVHLFDAHFPYAPPEPFRAEYAGRPYEGEIAFADQQLGRLVAALDARAGDPVVVVTADHGEGLGDGGEPTHGFLLHDPTVRVPLVLAGPGVTWGAREERVVSHVDIAPTLLALAGLPVPASLPGRDLRAGGSGQAYSEALTGRFSFGLSDLVARTAGEGRVTRGVRTSFYPHGPAGVAWVEAPAQAGHVADLDALVAGFGPALPHVPATDASALVALGYVEGDPGAVSGEIDPRDVIDVIPLTWQVRPLVRQGRVAEAAAMRATLQARFPPGVFLDGLEVAELAAAGEVEAAASLAWAVAETADTGSAWRTAAQHALEAGWVAEAEDAFARALARVPTDAESLEGRVEAAVRRGDLDLALARIDEALLSFPEFDRLSLSAGELMLREGRAEEARDVAVRALRVDRSALWPLSLLARALWTLGDDEGAIEWLDRLRMEVPRARDVRLMLVDWLLEVGRAAEALRVIRPAHAELPDDPQVRAAFARAEAAVARELARDR